MKICMTTESYGRNHGVSRYVFELSRYFSEGNDVHVYTNAIDEIPSKKIKVSRVHVPQKPHFLNYLVFSLSNTRRNILKKHSFDIIHGSSADSVFQDVITAHSCHKAWVERLKRERRMPFTLNPLDYVVLPIERYNYSKRKYSKIIAISNAVKKEIIHYYKVPEEDIVVIPNGVNLKEFNFDNEKKQSMREKLGIHEQDIVILFAAWEFERKGLKNLIKALGLIKRKNVKLIVVGGDNPVPYQRLAEKIGVQDMLIFTGFVPVISDYYATADIFAFPTTYEAFGLVITEAMASSLPVITFKEAGAAELIENGSNGVLLNNPVDCIELADNIKLLLENEQLRKHMGKMARETMKTYSWEEIARRSLDVYKTVIDDRGRK